MTAHRVQAPAGCVVWSSSGRCPEPPVWEQASLLYCDGHKPREGSLDRPLRPGESPPAAVKRFRRAA